MLFPPHALTYQKELYASKRERTKNPSTLNETSVLWSVLGIQVSSKSCRIDLY